MNAVQRLNERMIARRRDACIGDVMMREERARLKQERSLSDSVMDAYEMTERDERISEVSA